MYDNKYDLLCYMIRKLHSDSTHALIGMATHSSYTESQLRVKAGAIEALTQLIIFVDEAKNDDMATLRDMAGLEKGEIDESE